MCQQCYYADKVTLVSSVKFEICPAIAPTYCKALVGFRHIMNAILHAFGYKGRRKRVDSIILEEILEVASTMPQILYWGAYRYICMPTFGLLFVFVHRHCVLRLFVARQLLPLLPHRPFPTCLFGRNKRRVNVFFFLSSCSL